MERLKRNELRDLITNQRNYLVYSLNQKGYVEAINMMAYV